MSEHLGPEGMTDDDSSLEAVAHVSGVELPEAPATHQKTFTLDKDLMSLLSSEVADRAWEQGKWRTLVGLLEENGFSVVFDTYVDQELDQMFGRWTVTRP